MKQCKKGFALFLSLALIMGSFYVTGAKAETTNQTTAKWETLVGEVGSYSHSTLILYGESLFEASGNKLYRLNKNTGEITGSMTLAGNITSTDWSNWEDNYAAITEANGILYIPILSGRIQAVNASTLTSLWVTSSFNGCYNDSATVYHDGYLYGSLNNTKGGDSYVYRLNTTDEDLENPLEEKSLDWTYANTEGHYWTTPYITENGVLIGTNSTTGSILYLNKADGTLYDSYQTDNKICSGFAFDETNNKYYTVSYSGTLYQFALNAENEIEQTSSIKVEKQGAPVNNNYTYKCTAIPMFTNNSLYLLSTVSGTENETAFGGTMLTVMNPSGEIVSQGYTSAGFSSSPYLLSTKDNRLFFTLNNEAGGVYYYDTEKKGSDIESLFEPSYEYGNYCMDAVLTDGTTLYFTNDSCNVYAVNMPANASPSVSPSSAPQVSVTPSAAPTIPAAPKTVTKPKKVKQVKTSVAKKNTHGKRKVTLRWKNASYSDKYQIYVKKSSSKKFKRLATTKKATYSKKLKKGTYRFKVRGIRTVNKKVYYGSFSKVIKVKIR